MKERDYNQLTLQIKQWAQELGFQQAAISDIDLSQAETRLNAWLAKGYHGTMDYMSRHGLKRSHPEQLVPGTMRVIMLRMDYLPPATPLVALLKNPLKAVISRYALGRDYHKLIRKRLKQLAEKITENIGSHHYRVFTDSAPVLEKPLAEKAGLGWMGKHTNIINRQAGSYFFLGTIYTDLPLMVDTAVTNHCGSCQACLEVCPTKAIVAPYQLDARRCISYLTIEYKGVIAQELRPLMGNRIYGCDDCQWICPWNRFAKHTQESDFHPRHGLDDAELLALFSWDEKTFLEKTEGSAIRRIGYQQWLRNLAIALGNAPKDEAIVTALKAKLPFCSPLVAEHVQWAIEQQGHKLPINLDKNL